MDLRIASYNIHKCLGTDMRRSPLRIARVIAALDAGIVVLQEVDRRISPRRAALSLHAIERETDLLPLPVSLGAPSLGWHGQTILVRPELAQVGLVERLALPGLEPRGAILAEIEFTGGARLRLVAVHLGLFRRHRNLQLAAIRTMIEAHPPSPTVIIGDFNDWSHRGSGPALGSGYRLHAPGHSFPAPRPVASLDRIALGPGVHLRHAGVHSDPVAQNASDHLPIWAEIRIDPVEGSPGD